MERNYWVDHGQPGQPVKSSYHFPAAEAPYTASNGLDAGQSTGRDTEQQCCKTLLWMIKKSTYTYDYI